MVTDKRKFRLGEMVVYAHPLVGPQNHCANQDYEATCGAELGAVGIVTKRFKNDTDVKVLFVPLLASCTMYEYQLERWVPPAV